MNGRSSTEGTVKICVAGKWKTLCGYYFGMTEAQVVCNQLGFSNTGNMLLVL